VVLPLRRDPRVGLDVAESDHRVDGERHRARDRDERGGAPAQEQVRGQPEDRIDLRGGSDEDDDRAERLRGEATGAPGEYRADHEGEHDDVEVRPLDREHNRG